MTSLNKFLQILTENATFKCLYNRNNVIWEFMIEKESYVMMEAQENKTVKITIKTNMGSPSAVYTSSGEMLFVDFKEVEEFIKLQSKKVSYDSNIELNKLMQNLSYYADVVDNVLKGNKVNGFNLREDKDNNIFVLEEILSEPRKNPEHIIRIDSAKTNSLLELVKVTTILLIKDKETQQLKAKHYKTAYPLGCLEEYTILNNVVKKQNWKNNNNLESLVKTLKEKSHDQNLLKLLNYFELDKDLKNKSEKKVKSKI